MAVLYIRDAEGNKIPIPSIKGEKGDAGGLSVFNGDVVVENIPLGMSYASGNSTIYYTRDADTKEDGSLNIATGSCIFKTLSMASGESGDFEASSVYILSSNEADFGIARILPTVTEIGLQYKVVTMPTDGDEVSY